MFVSNIIDQYLLPVDKIMYVSIVSVKGWTQAMLLSIVNLQNKKKTNQ